MQYISPLHFIALSTAGTIDRKDLLLAKKKMLAELELNEGRGIEINGQEVSKNDIICFFDDLQQSADLSYHLAVYKDPVLLKFLEYNTLEKNDRYADNPLYADDAFITWLSPYYAASFVVFAAECFEDMADDEWATLLRNPLLMNSYNQETAWEGLEKSMEADINRLKLYADRQTMSHRPIMTQSELNEISPVCEFKHIMMLERLPAERFRQLRDEMAFAIMQICITAFNHTDRGWALNTIENARILAVSEELKTQVYNKKYEMERLAKGNSGSPNKVPLWTILRIALFVLFVGSRLFNSCNQSNNYDSIRNAPVYFQPAPGDTNLQKLQEEIKKMNSNQPVYIQSAPGDSLQKLRENIRKMNSSNLEPLSDSTAKKSLRDLMKSPDKGKPPF